MESKGEIRKRIKELKRLVSDDERSLSADSVFQKLVSMDLWKNAVNVLIYNSLKDELETHRFISKTIEKKHLYLPRVNGDDLEILSLSSEKDVVVGAYQILEPIGEDDVDPKEMDLVIVPGVAFDKSGNRIGRGKGYYDRLLSRVNCPLIGVGYDFQLLTTIPSEIHDIKLDVVITPSSYIEISK